MCLVSRNEIESTRRIAVSSAGLSIAWLVAFSLATILSESPSHAEAAQSDASVIIETPGRLQKAGDLDFGRLAVTGTAGTVRIAPNGSVTYTGGTLASGGTPRAATFELQTRLIDFVTFRGPTGGDTIQLKHKQDSTVRMTLRNFTTDLRSGLYLFTRTVTFHVGGTLDVAANQKAGVYQGTFLVTIDMP